MHIDCEIVFKSALINATMESSSACALQKAEHSLRDQLGLFILDKVSAVLYVGGTHIDCLLSDDHFHPLVCGTIHHEYGHLQRAVILVVADSVVINHRPLNAALLFSKLMWERVDERFRDCYLTGAEAATLNAASSAA